MQVKVDEDLPGAVAALPREAGHDTQTVTEENMGGATDVRIWARVQREGRLLVTADKGFADIRRHPPRTHPGIVLLRPREDGIRPVVELMDGLLAKCPLEQVAGCVTVVTPSGIRIRRG